MNKKNDSSLQYYNIKIEVYFKLQGFELYVNVGIFRLVLPSYTSLLHA